MVVARNCRRRRSLAVRSSSPASVMLPPDGASEPFCNSPMTLSAVTDFPDPLSPTRHKVSRSRTCNETPSMMRSLRGFLPRPTTRLSMSRTTLVISSLPELRHSGMVRQHQTADVQSHIGESRDSGFDASHRPGMTASGWLRRGACHRAALCADPLARNDVVKLSLAALPLFHAGIQRVARGVADQVDAEDRDRQHQSRPASQRRFYFKLAPPSRPDLP